MNSDYDNVTPREWAEYQFDTVEYDYRIPPGAAKAIRSIFDHLASPEKKAAMNLNSQTRAFVEDILRHPRDHEWSLQGLGMLRTYLDADKIERLHVWSNPHKTPDVSVLHDHPWDFTSQIIAGAITDVVYVPCPNPFDYPDAKLWKYQQIICGPNGCANSAVKDIWLRRCRPHVYTEGDSYAHLAPDIHASFPIDGTVTIISRTGDTERARVFWEPDKSWGSARPRTATNEEVDAIVGVALRNWF